MDTPKTIAQRAADIAEAAKSAPFFPAGLRDNLTAAAEFAQAVAGEVEQLRAEVEAIKANQAPAQG